MGDCDRMRRTRCKHLGLCGNSLGSWGRKEAVQFLPRYGRVTAPRYLFVIRRAPVTSSHLPPGGTLAPRTPRAESGGSCSEPGPAAVVPQAPVYLLLLAALGHPLSSEVCCRHVCLVDEVSTARKWCLLPKVVQLAPRGVEREAGGPRNSPRVAVPLCSVLCTGGVPWHPKPGLHKVLGAGKPAQ